MITNETIEKIKDAARIEDVVGRVVTLHRRGANLTGLCPFHTEKTPSFNVNPARNIFKCFGCGEVGNPITFVMKYDKCTYPEALRKIAEIYHIDVVEEYLNDEDRAKETERMDLFRINEAASQWYSKQLWETPEGKSVGLSYFIQKRGIREDIIKLFALGYSPAKSYLPQELKKQDCKEELIKKLHICGEYTKDDRTRWYDVFSGRVIFPWFNESGRIVAFNGRRLDGIKEKKYVNSNEVEGFFSKSETLYGLFQAKQDIAKAGFCYVVEGQMDVISMFQAGVKNVVASSGTALTQKQIKRIKRYTKNVVVLYDGDEAGQHASNRGMDMFFTEGMNVKVLLLPKEEDPDSMAHKLSSEEFQQYLQSNQTDFIQYKIDQQKAKGMMDVTVIKALAHDIAHTISLIPDSIDREVYATAASEQLNIDKKAFLNEIDTIIQTSRLGATKTAVQKDAQPKGETPVVQNDPYQKRIAACEKNIAMMLVRQGSDVAFVSDDGDITVGEYIINELDRDNIRFESVYASILEEYTQHMHDEGFNAQKHFSNLDENLKLLELSCDLMADKYQNTSGKEDINFGEVVPKMVMEIKLAIIEKQLQELKQQILAQHDDNEALMRLLKQQVKKDNVRRSIYKALGKI